MTNIRTVVSTYTCDYCGVDITVRGTAMPLGWFRVCAYEASDIDTVGLEGHFCCVGHIVSYLSEYGIKPPLSSQPSPPCVR